MTDFKITVKLDLEKDSWNYRSAFNKNTHSSIWKDQIANIKDFDFNQLIGIKEEETFPIMKDYLENFWNQNKEIATKKIHEMQKQFDQAKENIFEKMKKLTKHSIYRNDFTVFLTSLNRGPYNTHLGYTRSNLFREFFVKAFVHELLHFQTIHYYKEYIMSKTHDEKKFEDLKEALTFLLNHEFKEVMDGYDKGYPQHQELRKQLEDYRFHSDKNFDTLIEYGCTIV